jgi:predicted RNase H-like HicB family nuclease
MVGGVRQRLQAIQKSPKGPERELDRSWLENTAFLWHGMLMRKTTKREFSVIVERDEEGYYVASVPELRGCHTQARSLDQLMDRVREAILLCLEVERDAGATTEFIGVQRIKV